MDYEKAYKDALERAKKSLETAKTFDYEDEKIARDIRETVYSIFTELKDSDDEIRRELISLFQDCIDCKNHPYNASDSRRWIAWLEKQGHDDKKWIYKDVYLKEKEQLIQDGIDEVLENPQKYGLEKQGEQKPVWSEEDETVLNNLIYALANDIIGNARDEYVDWLKSLKDRVQLQWKPTEEQINAFTHFVKSVGESGYASPYDDNTKLLYSLLNDLQNLEKNEQKTTDKGEPKFKVGDWIAAAVYTWRVTGIKRLDYILQSQNGDTVDDTISYVDEQFHLWSIQDARDGDVLVCDDNKTPFIFKGLLDHHHPNCPVAYCGIDNENKFIVSSGISWWDDCKVEPATREQRELLFSKMKEAGYEWNADKKTLVMTGIDNDEEDERYEELIEDDEISIKQNPAWSKEDEEMFNGCLIDLRFLVDNGRKCNKKLYQNEIKWLEGIKDRVQPQQKQEWGKSDKYMLEAVIDVFFNNTMSGSKGREVYSKEIDWLKSLKDRVQLHWKPTNQQMNALKKTSEDDYVRYNTILKLLYNDLKKL